MKKSTIWLLTIVMASTIMGLLFVQIMYMEDMVRMRNEQFSETVKRSLYAVSDALEQDETRYYLDQDLNEAERYQFELGDRLPSEITGTISDNTNNLGKKTAPKPEIGSGNFKLSEQYKHQQAILKGQYLYQKGLLNEVILSILNQASDRPIVERADSARVNIYLKRELEGNGLEVPYEFAVESPQQGIVYHTAGYEPDGDKRSVFSAVLFPKDPESKRNVLKVFFPTQSSYIYASIKFMIPSFVFTFILMFIFIYTIVVIFRQKKLSEIKNDFINNMTHELKTPIASISLAAQMMNDESVTKSPAMTKHLGKVINDESKRLRFLVEKVLQMSMFDRKKAVFKKKRLDLNEMVENIANSFTLRVEHTGGKIYTEIEAVDSALYVDEVHFQPVINNLLDNAVKYRKPDQPINIYLRTWNDANPLYLSVRDTGLGIKKENLKKVFDKFYRVHTGNVHDVKGFGLGLAYVKKIIMLHNGDITIDSELGKGTKFTIKLPIIKD